jgi:hypothetical protein
MQVPALAQPGTTLLCQKHRMRVFEHFGQGAVRALGLPFMLGTRSRWSLLAATLVACTENQHAADDALRGVRPDASTTHGQNEASWQQVFTDLNSALTTVWGTSDGDVWAAGTDAKDGRGPLVLHFEAGAWVRKRAAAEGDLWWVHGFDEGPIFFGGSQGVVLRFDGRRFERIQAPRTYGTVYGVWGADASDVWAVGGDPLYGTGAFVWRNRNGRFESVSPIPVPATDVVAYFKVWGTSANDVWIVGTPGIMLHYDGTTFERVDPGVFDPLFTVNASPSARNYAVVGGTDLGILLERTEAGTWSRASLPQGTPLLTGVCLTDDGGFATGVQGTVLSRVRGTWVTEQLGLPSTKALHSVWADPAGGVWAAGGDVLVPPFGSGVLIHRGAAVPTTYSTDDTPPDPVKDGGTDARPPTRDAMPPIPADAARPPSPDRDAMPPHHDPPERSDAMPAMGEVSCGTATCTMPGEKCCADATSGVPMGCIAASAPCPSGSAPVTCDEPADCGAGRSCCLNRYLQAGALQNVDCESSCVGPSVCQMAADCGGSACTTFPIMKSYKTCAR